MANSSRCLALIAGVCVLCCSIAQAQETAVPRVKVSEPPLYPQWPAQEIAPGSKVFLVTTADPRHRHTCRVVRIESEEIACASYLKGAPKIYARTSVEALIQIGANNDVPLLLTFGGVSAGLFTGLVFLAMISTPWLVVACAVGFVVTFDVLFFLGMALSEHDRLLYLKPGEQLGVALH